MLADVGDQPLEYRDRLGMSGPVPRADRIIDTAGRSSVAPCQHQGYVATGLQRSRMEWAQRAHLGHEQAARLTQSPLVVAPALLSPVFAMRQPSSQERAMTVSGVVWAEKLHVVEDDVL